jgi:hypothetical protein
MIMIKKGFLILISLIALLSLDYCNSDILEVPLEPPPYKQRGIWIIGGAGNISGSTIYSEIDIYDPVTDTWYPDVAADATGDYIPSAFNMAASVSGKIYVMGGSPNAATVTNAVYEYDIAGNSWSAKGNISANLMASAVYTHANQIYLIGGTTTTTTANVVATHYVYDPQALGGTGLCSALAVYTTARSSMGVANFNGIVSYAGGRIVGGTGSTTNDIYMINPAVYTTSAPVEQVITSCGGMAYAGYAGSNGTFFFLVGGASGFTPAQSYFGLTAIAFIARANSFQVYTPPATASGLFTGSIYPSFSNILTTYGVVFASAVVSNYNVSTASEPTLYVFGGIKGNPSPSLSITDEVYSITANGTITAPSSYANGVGWTLRTAMPRPRYGFSAITINQ